MFDKLLKFMKKNLFYILLLPVFLAQTGNFSSRIIEPYASAECAACPLHFSYEPRNLVAVLCNKLQLVIGSWVELLDFGTPLTDKGDKSTPPIGIISPTSDNNGDNGASRSARKKTDDETNDGKSQRHISAWCFLLLCAFTGALGGTCGSLITLALLPNVQNSATPDV
jgi:hypothetical protein